MTTETITKHTSGLWEVYKTKPMGSDDSSLTPSRVIAVLHGRDQEETVCSFDTDTGYFANAEANARLIAAAPDLLQTLKAIAKWSHETGCTCDDDQMPCSWRFQQVVDDAIAKAEGSEATE